MRTLDGTYLTEVANHPEVRPWLGGEGFLDLCPAIADPANITLQFEGGGWALKNIGGCVYDVHSMFLPEQRGAKVREYLRQALEYVFIRTDAVKLVTRLPAGNIRARALSRVAGFRPWFTKGGDEYASLSIEDWIQNSYSCQSSGERFGLDDKAHESAVGAMMLMCRAGNVGKGVWHFNQWASCAGVGGADLISVSPPMVRVGGMLLHGLEMEAVPCPL